MNWFILTRCWHYVLFFIGSVKRARYFLKYLEPAQRNIRRSIGLYESSTNRLSGWDVAQSFPKRQAVSLTRVRFTVAFSVSSRTLTQI